ncbi:MerR family transcriptional regulator [Amycolatopsis sp. 195334CR]|uniref:MerR family transcriptional regulator n=1 Tax=Amycolatopsis sp. 195334CR TaxID=2814588 RepID=UPI001A8F88DC|nr:MerR family transcriptional regulator [Amycolatopsis sp. 195334CR]MBN6033806.1 MerR family transcriptional regulator [Amycolatopsis sp. 195334CR]
MFAIGEFARLGRVSVRMLRHYDSIGLLRPVRVDEASGYRYYDAAQLRDLNRVVALKELGFTLEQVREIIEEKLNPEELRGMLRLRRAQLEAQISADTDRLDRVEARLRTIEREGHMNTEDVLLKSVAPLRVAELSGVAASYASHDIGPVVQPLFVELCRRLDEAGLRIAAPTIAYYEPVGEEQVMVHTAAPVALESGREYDFDVVDLPALGTAATVLHHGTMDEVDRTFQTLAFWIEEHGYTSIGHAREVYLDYEAPERGVTELQVLVNRQDAMS